MLDLAEHSVHLWFLDLQLEPRAIASLEDIHVQWLSERERQRFRRLQLPRRRQHYLMGKVFTRQVLSRYSALAPDAWQFVENAYGKPAIANPLPDDAAAPLCFNLSHSRQRFVLAVSRVAATGVDVEYCARKRRVSRLTQRYFTRAEANWLLGLPSGQQQEAFYQLWTLKEAYMKARGLGQALALDAFEYDLSRAGRIGFAPDTESASGSGVAAAHWCCWRLDDPLAPPDASDRYALALVLGTARGNEAALRPTAFRYGLRGEDAALPLTILASSEGV